MLPASLCIATLALLLPTTALGKEIHFEGLLTDGEVYERAIAPDLDFRLDPVFDWRRRALGWQLEIRSGNEEMTGCVTPPAHGPHPTDIFAWHFKDRQTGLYSSKSQEFTNVREFWFALNTQDQKAACDGLAEVLYGTKSTQKQKPRPVKSGDGRFRIIDVQFGSRPGEGQDPVIEKLRFEVTLTFPETPAGRRKKQ